MLTLVQKGTNPRSPLVIGYFVGPAAVPALLAALGPEPHVVTDCDNPNGRFAQRPGAGGVDTLSQVAGFIHEHVGLDLTIDAPFVLIGWSAGCEAVREQLRADGGAGHAIDAVIALDGISGSWPGPSPAQLAPWQEMAGRARAGEALFVLSHSQQTYTEHIPVGVEGGPFASTVTTARLLFGEGAPAPGAEASDGSFHVISCPSPSISATAHVAQVREVLPDVARRILVPWLAARASQATVEPPPDTDPAPTPQSPAARPLRIGDAGPSVVALQQALNAAGAAPAVATDGAFGPKTRAAVAYVQFAGGLPQTGEADAQVMAILRGVPASEPPAGPSTLSQGLLAAAQADVGVRESGGHNRGVRVDQYNEHAKVGLGSDYCAPAVWTWMDEAAAKLGVAPAIKGSPAAKGLEAQLRAAGRWVDRAELLPRAAPGWILVFDRHPPAEEWQGHCGVLERVEGAVLHTIEANAGPSSDEVVRETHPVSDPLLRGGGWVDP